MRKKLLISFLVVLLIAIGLSTMIFWSKGFRFIDNQSKSYYLTQANLVADLFAVEELQSIDDYYKFVEFYGEKYKFRITIIDQLGDVLADSGTKDALDNHGTREEVASALRGQSSTVNRYSKTMGQEYSYSAVPVTNGEFQGVIRISLPLEDLQHLNDGFRYAIFMAVLFCLCIAIIAAIWLANILAKPINDIANAAQRISEGDYDTKLYTRDQSELGKLAGAFNKMTLNLKNTVDSLMHRNVELEAMLSSMDSGVIAIDDTDAILFHNQAFVDIVHATSDTLIHQSLYGVVRNAAIFDAVEKVRRSQESTVEEGALIRTKGETKLIRVTATPLDGLGKHNFGVLMIVEDITKIKKLENMRTDFVSNVTHELKTPLTSIRGFIDTLKNGAIRDEAVANKFLAIIDIEAERLYLLIQDILILSEIESKRETEVIACDMNECIESVIDLLAYKLTDKISVSFLPESNIKSYPCNPDRMKQLLINLLDNGIKYTEEGTIVVTCSQKGNQLELRVKDTGIGISEEHLSRIFERFYRVDRGRARKQGGTGLGLSIVKHIVELYNGNICVNSLLGEGTEFVILLPYYEV